MSEDETQELSVDELYIEIDGLWPLRRNAVHKASEKDLLCKAIESGADAVSIISYLEGVLAENTKGKLPQLLDILPKFIQTKPVVIETSKVYTNIQKPVSTPTESQKGLKDTFDEIFKQWPRNFNYPQSSQRAFEAFEQKCAECGVEKVAAVCFYYVNEFNTMASGKIFPLSMKNFLLSEERYYEAWDEQYQAQNGETYDRSYFDAAWSWYPNFPNRFSENSRRDGLIMYRRFIGEHNMIDFLCAVKAYRSEQGDVDSEGNPIPEHERIKYVRSFAKFFAHWESMRDRNIACEFDKQVADFIEPEVRKVAQENGIELRGVFPDNLLNSWIRYEAAKNGTKAIDIVGLLVKETGRRLQQDVPAILAPEIVFRLKNKCKDKLPLPIFIGGIPFDDHPDKAKYLAMY